MPFHSLPKRRTNRGFTLIEVLVAILVIALGMLAMIVMQINATKLTKTSELRSMGALLAADLADRMRANPGGASSYAFSEAYPSTAPTFTLTKPCTGSNDECTPVEIATADLTLWRQTLNGALPNGWARVSAFDSTNKAIDLWLIWREQNERSGAQSPIVDPCPANVTNTSSGDVATALRCMYFRVNL